MPKRKPYTKKEIAEAIMDVARTNAFLRANVARKLEAHIGQ